jgi:hypothetical protein
MLGVRSEMTLTQISAPHVLAHLLLFHPCLEVQDHVFVQMAMSIQIPQMWSPVVYAVVDEQIVQLPL